MTLENKISSTNETDEKEKNFLGYSIFVPMIIVVITLLFMAGMQTSELFRERNKLIDSKFGQDKRVEESQKVRSQFNSIAKDTEQLAAQGNQNAALLLKQLKALGVTVSQTSK